MPQAYVTNLATAETSRWANLDVRKVLRVGASTLLLLADGRLVPLGGADDGGAAIPAMLETNYADGGSALFKRVRAVEAEAETSMRLGAVPQDVAGVPLQPPSQGGRRYLVPQGTKARFWKFRVEPHNGQPLAVHALEICFNLLSRRA